MSETENIFDRTIRDLRYRYWLSIILLAAFFLLIIFDLIPHSFKGKNISVTLERYAIVISIIAIPAALKLFAGMLKKIPPVSDIGLVVKKYKRATYTRLCIINGVTLMNILLYAVSGNMNFFWFTVVLFIIYIYCKPSYPELAALVDKEKDNKEKGDDIQNDIQNNENSHVADNNSKAL